MITKAIFDDSNDAIDRVMNALGDKTRRQILAMLKREAMAVGDIADHLPISRPAVSKHLRILTAAGLVTHVSQGTRNIFRLNTRGFAEARIYLDSFWDAALTNFQRLAEAQDIAEAQREAKP